MRIMRGRGVGWCWVMVLVVVAAVVEVLGGGEWVVGGGKLFCFEMLHSSTKITLSSNSSSSFFFSFPPSFTSKKKCLSQHPQEQMGTLSPETLLYRWRVVETCMEHGVHRIFFSAVLCVLSYFSHGF